MKINVTMTENGDSFPAQMRDPPETIPVVFRNTQTMTVTANYPSGGSIGDILTKTGNADDGVSWVTPATDFSGDNTRPMAASGVLEQIGNINVLLAAI